MIGPMGFVAGAVRRPDEVEPAEVDELRNYIQGFARTELRAFPWRRDSVSFYEYTISEVLLQQTRAESVAKFVPAFVGRIPDWDSLAGMGTASLAEFLRPLGFHHQRAARLIALAQQSVELQSRTPTYEHLIQFPALGQYVASAIATRFGGECHPFVDVNMAAWLKDRLGLVLRVDIRKDKQFRRLCYRLVEGSTCLKSNWAILDIATQYRRIRQPR